MYTNNDTGKAWIKFLNPTEVYPTSCTAALLNK
jgi:hypothetical protein